ncbi:hypothetical protein TK34_10775 [Aeromonas hydrophila]|nr:hypothetical protein TK34_10775 [Aeromonas hydrophila]
MDRKGMRTVSHDMALSYGHRQTKNNLVRGAGGETFIGTGSVIGAKGENMEGLSWDTDLAVTGILMVTKKPIATKII